MLFYIWSSCYFGACFLNLSAQTSGLNSTLSICNCFFCNTNRNCLNQQFVYFLKYFYGQEALQERLPCVNVVKTFHTGDILKSIKRSPWTLKCARDFVGYSGTFVKLVVESSCSQSYIWLVHFLLMMWRTKQTFTFNNIWAWKLPNTGEHLRKYSWSRCAPQCLKCVITMCCRRAQP